MKTGLPYNIDKIKKLIHLSFMNLDIDFKKFFEKLPKTIFTKNVVISFYSKYSFFPVVFCAGLIASERDIPLKILDISDMDASLVIETLSGDGFFHEEKVYVINGVLPESNSKKAREKKDRILDFLKKPQVNTIIFYNDKWPFQKSEGKNFFNISLFEIPHWFYRKIVLEKFEKFGIPESDILLEKIIEEIHGKDLDSLYNQLDKLCIFLIDKQDLSLIDTDLIKEAISGREDNYYDLLENLIRFVLTGEVENAVSVFETLKQYMESISIVSYIIKRVKVFTEFYNLYGKNAFFDDFCDKYSGKSTRNNFAEFRKDLGELKKNISDILPVNGKSFLDELKTSDHAGDFRYLCSVVRKEYLERFFERLIILDGEFKSGLIKTPEDIFLLLMGEMKNGYS